MKALNGNDGSKLLPWLICFSASLFFFYEFIQGNMFASIADNIMDEFHLQADKMAYLSSIYYAANVIFLLLAGLILDHFSNKKTIIVAMMLCVGSTFIFSVAHSFYVVLLCRFITGIGSAFCFLGPVRLASRWFPAKKMALVTGAIITMAMTGGMCAQYPLTVLVQKIGWRSSLLSISWIGVVILIVMWVGIVEKEVTQRRKISIAQLIANLKRAYLNWQNVQAGLYTSLMNMAIAVLGAMIGTLYIMQKLGVSKSQASVVNSMLFLGAIIGGPVIGWYSDKIGLRLFPMRIAAFVSLVLMLLILYGSISLSGMKALFFLLGFVTAAQVISYALVAESSVPELTATAVSIISVLTQGGYIVYQNLFGYLLTHHEIKKATATSIYSLQDYQYASLIMPLGLLIALLLVCLGLKETYCRQREA